MADRGAAAALVEVCPTLAADGRANSMRPEVLVYTNVAQVGSPCCVCCAVLCSHRHALKFTHLVVKSTTRRDIDRDHLVRESHGYRLRLGC